MDHLIGGMYREHAGILTARLVRHFGVAHLDLIESAVQESFATALIAWADRGPPDAPLAWLTTVAKNAVRDRLRAATRRDALLAQAAVEADEAAPSHQPLLANELADDLLRMMFVACHPNLPIESQLALVLRTLCSFPTLDLARAFLTSEDAVEKRLVRARAELRALRVEFDLPPADELVLRLDSVLAALYMLFGEGYHAHSGDRVVRVELCQEALRLARLLAAHPRTQGPRPHALVALFCLQASRLAARFDQAGELVPLAEQDRGRWDRGLVAEGLEHLDAAGVGTSLSTWHLQAGIAACHALAPSFERTPWAEVVRFYDLLRDVDGSPIVELHRAIAVSFRDGPEAGLALLGALESQPRFRKLAMFRAAQADMFGRRGDHDRSAAVFLEAAELAATPGERRALAQRAARARLSDG